MKKPTSTRAARGSENEHNETIVEEVKSRYGQIAEGALSGCCGDTGGCCGPVTPAALAFDVGYTPDELQGLPDGANLGLGCGAPVAFLDLQPGESVLDLGSGAGVDCFLAARAVGPEGHVIGIDMTPEMVAKARANAAAAGHANVSFRQSRLEDLPVDADTVDAVTSNCVINLVPDKGVVFSEIARVLRSGGRLVISDVVLDGALPDAIGDDVVAYVGCVAGALEREEYFRLLASAGIAKVEVLHDSDFLDVVGDAVPVEVKDLLSRTGISLDAIRGKVRSITYRAEKG